MGFFRKAPARTAWPCAGSSARSPATHSDGAPRFPWTPAPAGTKPSRCSPNEPRRPGPPSGPFDASGSIRGELLEGKPDIIAGGDLVAFLAVLRGAARIDDEGALLLAGHVGVDAHHPGIYLGEQHAPPGVVHVLRPAALRLDGGLDAGVALLAHVADERGHPVDVLLDAARDIAEGSRVVRPDQRQQVGEALDLQAEVGARPVRPLVLQPPAAPAADVDSVERPGDGVEAGGVDDHLEAVLGVTGLDASGRDPLDRRLAYVHEAHVRLVEDLVVAALQRHAPSAKAVVGRDQLLRDLRVHDSLADLPAHELGDGGVGVLVDQHVAEVAHPDAEAGLAVELLEERLALLRTHLERVARVGLVDEAPEGVT